MLDLICRLILIDVQFSFSMLQLGVAAQPTAAPVDWQWEAPDAGIDPLDEFDLQNVAGKGAASVVYEAVYKPKVCS